MRANAMSRSSLEQEIVDDLSRLDSAGQVRVRDFVRALAKSPQAGEPGQNLITLVGVIPVEDLQEISRSIEESCERVDVDGWAIAP